MFEDCLPSPEKSGRPPKDRAAGVLVSLLVHAILGYGVYHARFTIKMLPSRKEEVRNIMIVPPLKVRIPRIVGGRGVTAEPTVPQEEAGPAGGGRRVEQRRQEPEAGPAAKAEGPPGGSGRPPGEAAPGAAGAGSVITSLASKSREGRPATAGGSGLTIALAPPGTPAGTPGAGPGIPHPDFSRYDRGAVGGYGGYGSGRGRGGGGGGIGRQRVGISIPLKGYDLLPWASVVVDRIQRYWELPAVSELPRSAKVRMIVVIKKSGELDSIEILEGTTIEVLDRAALEAIRGGLPFPPLPPDFPGDLLEITFEFAYND